jgi:hypothetical protein
LFTLTLLLFLRGKFEHHLQTRGKMEGKKLSSEEKLISRGICGRIWKAAAALHEGRRNVELELLCTIRGKDRAISCRHHRTPRWVQAGVVVYELHGLLVQIIVNAVVMIFNCCTSCCFRCPK